MAAELLEEGVELMLAGMGTVFVFLTTLVVATSLMSRIIGRFQPEPATANPDAQDEEVAAVTAAIAHHRSRQS